MRTKIILSKDYLFSYITLGGKYAKLSHRPCYKREGQGVIGHFRKGNRNNAPVLCHSCRTLVPQDIINKFKFIW